MVNELKDSFYIGLLFPFMKTIYVFMQQHKSIQNIQSQNGFEEIASKEIH